jgi:dihydroorotase-like cyclic amidohydrolase
MPGLIDLNVCFNADPFSGSEDVTPEPVISATSENSSSTTTVSSEAWEGYDCGTRAAISGGVTTVIESPSLRYMNLHTVSQVNAKLRALADATLYCDVGLLGYLSPANLGEAYDMKQAGVFGFKAYMIPPALDFPYLKDEDLYVALETVAETDLPLFLHPEKTSERLLYMSSPFRKISEEDRSVKDSIPSYCYAAAFPEDLNPSSTEVSPISLSTTPQRHGDQSRVSPIDERVLERMIRKHQDFMEPLVKAEMNTYYASGATLFPNLPDIANFLLSPRTPERRSDDLPNMLSFDVPQRKIKRPPPITCAKQQKANENSDYEVLLANCPAHWESNGVASVVAALKLASEVRVHMSNICSANAVQLLKKTRDDNPDLYLTWETSSSYLNFSSSDVSTGDTRFKMNPPVRDEKNQELLKFLLKLDSIDTVNSYHRPVKPSLKFLHQGDFQRAMNGVCSAGLTLQTTWAALKQRKATLCKLSRLLCETPARIAGLHDKGSIEVGKHADLVVWDPAELIEIGFEEVFYRHPQVCPFLGRQLPGKIHKVYLRGQAAYSPPYFAPLGKALHSSI